MKVKIKVRHKDETAGERMALHVETHLLRVLGPFLKRVHAIDVTLDPPTVGSGEQKEVRCYFTVKLLPDGCIHADAHDRDDMLAIYRTAEKVKFYLEQRSAPPKIPARR